MYKYIIISFVLLSSCSSLMQTNKQKQYVISLISLRKDKTISDRVYLLVNSNDKEMDSFFNHNKYKDYYSLDSMLIKLKDSYIFDSYVNTKYWNKSCKKKRFTTRTKETISKEDSIKFKKILDELRNLKKYKYKNIKYTFQLNSESIGLSEIKKIEYCKVGYTMGVNDSSIIINNKLVLKKPKIRLDSYKTFFNPSEWDNGAD